MDIPHTHYIAEDHFTFPDKRTCKFRLRLGSGVGGGGGGRGHSCIVNFEVISIYTYQVLSKF